MAGKLHHHGSSSLAAEDLNLLHKARGSPDGGGAAGEGRGSQRGQWKCRLLGSLGVLRPRRERCVVCLQVQHVAGLPPAAEGREVVVGWRSKGGDGEHTAPVRVARGAAAFDEVFLHYFSAGGATLRSFTVWAALAGSSESGELGAFPVDLVDVAAAESSNDPRFGGKAISFPLGGAAAGAVLTVSVYCRVMEQAEHRAANGHARDERKNKGKMSSSYASCLPDLSCLRNRAAAAGSARRAASLRSERGGFITIENSAAEMEGGSGRLERVEDEEGAGFITMEKGTISSRSTARRAAAAAADEEGDEKPCLFMELSEAAAAFEVEEEFLAMLEERYLTRSKEIEKGLDMGLELDLESLIRDAEMELAKAEQAWKSKVGAAMVEEEEYKELLRRWSSRDHHHLAAASDACSWGFGFGSPI